MRVALCGVNNIVRKPLENCLCDYFYNKSISLEIKSFRSDIDLMYEIDDGYTFDVIFLNLDVNGSGMRTAGNLRESGYTNELVFIADNANFALESYDVRAVGYLLKQNFEDKLENVLERIFKHIDVIGNANSYTVTHCKNVYRIPYKDIVYVESINSKCILHTASGDCYTLYKHLDEIESELSEKYFLRCHRSYLVNMHYIVSMDKQFTLSNGEIVLVRQKELKKIRKMYLDYIDNRDKSKK